MGHTANLIIGVLHIDFTLEVLHSFQIAVISIGVTQTIRIRILRRNQIIAIIGERNDPAHAVHNGLHVAIPIIGHDKRVYPISDPSKIAVCVAKLNKTAIPIGNTAK